MSNTLEIIWGSPDGTMITFETELNVSTTIEKIAIKFGAFIHACIHTYSTCPRGQSTLVLMLHFLSYAMSFSPMLVNKK